MKKTINCFLIITILSIGVLSTSVMVDAEKSPNTFNESTRSSNTKNNYYVKDTLKRKTDIKKISELWNNFIDEVSVIEVDGKYWQLIMWDKCSILPDETDFEEITGRDGNEYINMSPLERLLWSTTYLTPMKEITSSDYKSEFNKDHPITLEEWNYSVIECYELYKIHGNDKMAQAYMKLMEYDYYYLLENGSVINFITGELLPDYCSLEKFDSTESEPVYENDASGEEEMDNSTEEANNDGDQEKENRMRKAYEDFYKKHKGNSKKDDGNSLFKILLFVFIVISIIKSKPRFS